MNKYQDVSSHVQQVAQNIMVGLECELINKIKNILTTYYPMSSIDEMTKSELNRFMEENGIEVEIDTESETVRSALKGDAVAYLMKTDVKVYRITREELK